MLPALTVTLNPAIDQTLWAAGFRAGQVNRVEAEQINAGGKGVNVAAVLADLGASVVVTGILGNQNDQVYNDLFRMKAIEDRFIRVNGHTRAGLKIINPRDGETTDINFPGLLVPEGAIAELKGCIAAFVTQDAWVVLAGSLPIGVDLAVYGELIDIVHSSGGKVAVDTSGEPLRLALARRPDMVKPNVEELGQLLGRPLDTVADRLSGARELVHSYGVGTTVLSMGGEGALFVTAREAILARPPSVDVVSTVGAGDAMCGGTVFSLARNASLDNTARLATALGSDAVTRVGAGLDPGHSYRALLDRVVLEKMA